MKWSYNQWLTNTTWPIIDMKMVLVNHFFFFLTTKSLYIIMMRLAVLVSSTIQTGALEFTWENVKPRDRAPFARISARTFRERGIKDKEKKLNKE